MMSVFYYIEMKEVKLYCVCASVHMSCSCLHAAALYAPKMESWHGAARGIVATSLPETEALKACHIVWDGQHESV